MEDEKKFSEQMKEELDSLKKEEILNPAYRKKKLLIYWIRTLIAVLLIVSFWNYSWVRWLTLLYIPLNLFSLGAILFPTIFLKKKLERAEQKLKELEEEWEEESEA